VYNLQQTVLYWKGETMETKEIALARKTAETLDRLDKRLEQKKKIGVNTERLARRYIQKELGTLIHKGLAMVPGMNRSAKKRFLREQKELARKSKQQ
jgi:hypothetical protein